MIRSIFFAFVASLILLTGCGDGEKEKQLKERIELRDKVWAIHDEVMPKMDAIHSAHKELDVVLQELLKDSVLREQFPTHIVEEANEKLDNAHNEMMGWMRAFKYPKDDVAQKVAMDYLMNEKTKIEKVAELTNSSIAEADEIVVKFKHIYNTNKE